MRIEGFLFSPPPILPETRKQDQKTRFPSVDADRTVEFIRYVICQLAHVYRCVRHLYGVSGVKHRHLGDAGGTC